MKRKRLLKLLGLGVATAGLSYLARAEATPPTPKLTISEYSLRQGAYDVKVEKVGNEYVAVDKDGNLVTRDIDFVTVAVEAQKYGHVVVTSDVTLSKELTISQGVIDFLNHQVTLSSNSAGIRVTSGKLWNVRVNAQSNYTGKAIILGKQGLRIRKNDNMLKNIKLYCPTPTGYAIYTDTSVDGSSIEFSTFRSIFIEGFEYGFYADASQATGTSWCGFTGCALELWIWGSKYPLWFERNTAVGYDYANTNNNRIIARIKVMEETSAVGKIMGRFNFLDVEIYDIHLGNNGTGATTLELDVDATLTVVLTNINITDNGIDNMVYTKQSARLDVKDVVIKRYLKKEKYEGLWMIYTQDVTEANARFVITDKGDIKYGDGTNTPNNILINNNGKAQIDNVEALILPTAPPPITKAGSVYFDPATGTLYIYDGTTWKSVSLT